MNEKEPNTTIWLEPAVLDKPYSIQFRDDHVHVTLGDGTKITTDVYREYWKALAATCERHKCRRVLIEGEAPRTDHSTNQIIEAGMRTAAVPELWLAYCLRRHEDGDSSELYEAIASSQSTHVRFFSDRDKALNWLRVNGT